MICPNCGSPVTEAQSLCPNCGADLHAVQPSPPGPIQRPSTGPRLLTGWAWSDMTLGFIVSFLSNAFIWVLFANLLVMGVLYISLQKKFPLLSRGIGYGMLAGLAVVAGALVYCSVKNINI